ncbi:MAG: dialkylresorcinol condensing enzyme DarA [Flavobacteriales bacterium]|nr:dialkylresorcinol condensing enzyme DarA [Flavobacteriales bacterium]
MKNVLVAYYSQSGQLEEIVKNVVAPLEMNEQVSVTYYKIEMEKEFPFPWDKASFFDAFPESRLQIPASIVAPPEEVLSQKYDLVVLGAQVWYLSPSIPLNSFLKSEYVSRLLKDTPVVTVYGCRNMWVMAQEKVKILLNGLNARLVGNIVLEDKAPNHISVITIVQWMFTGEKKRFLGFFPKPGVADEEIVGSKKFGEVILPYLKKGSYEGMQEELVKKGAVVIHWFTVKMEKTGHRTFGIWANLISKKNQSRKTWLKVFNKYLLVAIWLIAPLVQIIQTVLYPLNYKGIRRDDKYYKGVGLRE